MGVDRGVLASLDQRLLAGLERDDRFQMARVPVAPAEWSTWKRYCGSAEISMGRAIAALIDHELARVAENSGDDSPVLIQRACEQLKGREAVVANRERNVAQVEERLRHRNKQLRQWEADLRTLAQRVQFGPKQAAQRDDSAPKIGRNDRCPCRSGLKYKHCHGLPARPPNSVPR